MSATTSPTGIDPIQAAIAAAAASAAAATQAQAGAVAPLVQGATAVAVPGQKLSMDQMQGGLNVQHWIGVKEFCFTFGQSKTPVMEELDVEIDMMAVQVAYAVKFGNPAIYFRTYDHVTEVRGGSWAAAVAKAAAADPNVREYRTADIPMTLLKAVMHGKGKDEKVIAEVGETLGHSLSTTNWGNWESFYRDCQRLGLQGSKVQVRLGFQKRTNAKNNVWGVVTFTLIPPAVN